MCFPTHLTFTELLEEPQSNPQRSELVKLPEDITEGTMERDIYTIEQNGCVSTDILQVSSLSVYLLSLISVCLY